MYLDIDVPNKETRTKYLRIRRSKRENGKVVKEHIETLGPVKMVKSDPVMEDKVIVWFKLCNFLKAKMRDHHKTREIKSKIREEQEIYDQRHDRAEPDYFKNKPSIPWAWEIPEVKAGVLNTYKKVIKRLNRQIGKPSKKEVRLVYRGKGKDFNSYKSRRRKRELKAVFGDNFFK